MLVVYAAFCVGVVVGGLATLAWRLFEAPPADDVPEIEWRKRRLTRVLVAPLPGYTPPARAR